jgi:hypothetical protein
VRLVSSPKDSEMSNIPIYVGVACMLIAAALRARTALKDRGVRRQVTDTAPCAKCDSEIRLNEKHVTFNRHVEYMDSEGSITVVDAETVKSFHLNCAP